MTNAQHSVEAEPVTRHVDGAVATITLNNPAKLNPLSAETIELLIKHLQQLGPDESIRIIVLAATGQAFSAGHDLKEMRAMDRSAYEHLFSRCSKLMLTINRQPQPVIAQVQGLATAAGCQLVGACDLAIAGESARFAVSGINVGLFCSTPAVALSRNVTPKRAFEMLLTGDFIDAPTAKSYGLINEVVGDDELPSASMALARKIAAKPPVALRMGKQLFYEQLGFDLEAAYARAGEVMAYNMDSHDARAGIDAFFDKVTPVWQDR